MKLETLCRDGVAMLVVTGEMDAAEKVVVARTLRGLLDRGETRFVFDCEKVTFMGSTGLGCLLAVRREVLERSGGVALVRPAPILRKVLRDLGIESEFPVYGTREEAVAALTGAVPGVPVPG